MPDNANQESNRPLVSVAMFTYNHQSYIVQAIGGVLMQRTDFPFELVIGEDHSTDDTRNIVFDYQRRFPEVIRVIASDKNVGVADNVQRTIQSCRGKYVALCEGDDYWTDPLKLQKQVDFLESHRGYSVCSHQSLVYREDRKKFYNTRGPTTPLDYTQQELLTDGKRSSGSARVVTRTCSLVFRRDCFPDPYPQWLKWVFAGDKFVKLLLTESHMLHVLPDRMSCYRMHAGGICSCRPKEQLWKRQVRDLWLLRRHFGKKHPDQVAYATDRFNYYYADVIASRKGMVRGAGCVLKMLKYPEVFLRHPLTFGRMLLRAIQAGVRSTG